MVLRDVIEWNTGMIGIVKYDGCYYNGMKHGYGLLYDRRGDIEYEELFKNDCSLDIDRRLDWNDNNDLCIHSHSYSLMLMISILIFPLSC